MCGLSAPPMLSLRRTLASTFPHPMKATRRNFITSALVGGAAAALAPRARGAAQSVSSLKTRYAKLDEVLKRPVLRRDLFTSPIIIESLELLKLNNNFLCRVRSKDGAEGISV